MERIYLCFNDDNPKHMRAYDFLEAQGRKKSKFIASLIDEYLENPEKFETISKSSKSKTTSRKKDVNKNKTIKRKNILPITEEPPVTKEDTSFNNVSVSSEEPEPTLSVTHQKPTIDKSLVSDSSTSSSQMLNLNDIDTEKKDMFLQALSMFG